MERKRIQHDSPFMLSSSFENCYLDNVKVKQCNRVTKGGIGYVGPNGLDDCRVDRHSTTYTEVLKTFKPVQQLTHLKPKDRLPLKSTDREAALVSSLKDAILFFRDTRKTDYSGKQVERILSRILFRTTKK